MATVPDIIDDLGGAKKIADATGIPMTTVHSWKRNRYVPAWRVPALVGLADEMGKPYSASDFPVERPTPDTQAAA